MRIDSTRLTVHPFRTKDYFRSLLEHSLVKVYTADKGQIRRDDYQFCSGGWHGNAIAKAVS